MSNSGDHTRNSPGERFHPLVLLVVVLLTLILIAFSRSLVETLTICGIVTVLLLILRLNFKQIFHSIRYLLWMLPFTFIMHIGLSPEGWAFFRHLISGNPDITLLHNATIFTVRIFGFLYVMGGTMQMISMGRLLDSLYIVLRPLQKMRLPVDALFQILFLGLRFFPILQDEAKRLQEVRRGFGLVDPESLVGRVKSHLATAIPLFISTLHRAEVVAQTMTMRGYVPGKPRSIYAAIPWRMRDSIILGSTLLLAGLLFLL